MKIGVVGLRGYPFPDAYSKILARVGPRLVERGHEVTLFLRRKWSDPSVRSRDGMRLVTLPHVPTKSLDTLSYGLLASLRCLFSDLDVVHFHGTALAPWTWIPRLLGKRTVLQIHALDWQRDKFGPVGRKMLHLFEWMGMRFPGGTGVISQALQEQFVEHYGKTCHHIPQGVTLPGPRTVKPVHEFGIEGRPYVLYVGRLVPEKNCHDLIAAFQRSGVDGKLVLAGEASFTSEYVEKLRAQAGPNVLFPGSMGERELDVLYSGARLYVQASRVEGLSMAVLEAMSYGVPTLVSDIPANREAVGDAGWTYPVGDQEALSQHIRRVFDDQVTRDDTGNRGRARVASAFSWDSVVDATELLYRGAPGSGSAPADVEAGAGPRPDLSSAAGGGAPGGRVRAAHPDLQRSARVLLRPPRDGGGEAVPHVEAADDGSRGGDEL